MRIIGQMDRDDQFGYYERLAWVSAPQRFGGSTAQIGRVGRAMMAVVAKIEDPFVQSDAYRTISYLPLSPELVKRAEAAWWAASARGRRELYGEHPPRTTVPGTDITI
jgi:hypothetical protein